MSCGNVDSLNKKTKDCCGCGLCENVCVKKHIKKAITERNSWVFYKEEGCVQCGLCDSFCPLNKDLFHDISDNVFSVKAIDPTTLDKSSSGGAAHEMSKTVIEKGGVVYGAAWVPKHQRVEHYRVKDIKGLEAFQGSKYVQSILTTEVYNEIKEDLLDKEVLFVGTPCEVAAVRSYTGDPNNLTCIDLICHGTPSPAMLNEQLKAITSNDVKRISFREGLRFVIKVDDDDKIYELDWEDVPYYSLFMHFASLREYCYHCKYACNSRVGDITLGDYVENNKGFSCVIINTDKGKTLLEHSSDRISIERRDSALLQENHAYNKPTERHRYTDKFTLLYKNKGLEYSYKKTFYMFVLKRKIKKVLKKLL